MYGEARFTQLRLRVRLEYEHSANHDVCNQGYEGGMTTGVSGRSHYRVNELLLLFHYHVHSSIGRYSRMSLRLYSLRFGWGSAATQHSPNPACRLKLCYDSASSS